MAPCCDSFRSALNSATLTAGQRQCMDRSRLHRNDLDQGAIWLCRSWLIQVSRSIGVNDVGQELDVIYTSGVYESFNLVQYLKPGDKATIEAEAVVMLLSYKMERPKGRARESPPSITMSK